MKRHWTRARCCLSERRSASSPLSFSSGSGMRTTAGADEGADVLQCAWGCTYGGGSAIVGLRSGAVMARAGFWIVITIAARGSVKAEAGVSAGMVVGAAEGRLCEGLEAAGGSVEGFLVFG
jgi:hypothetical protein